MSSKRNPHTQMSIENILITLMLHECFINLLIELVTPIQHSWIVTYWLSLRIISKMLLYYQMYFKILYFFHKITRKYLYSCLFHHIHIESNPDHRRFLFSRFRSHKVTFQIHDLSDYFINARYALSADRCLDTVANSMFQRELYTETKLVRVRFL